MTPEQRLAKLMLPYYVIAAAPRQSAMHSECCRDILRAFYAERNAALEEVVGKLVQAFVRDELNGPTCERLVAEVRSLKKSATRKRKR